MGKYWANDHPSSMVSTKGGVPCCNCQKNLVTITLSRQANLGSLYVLSVGAKSNKKIIFNTAAEQIIFNDINACHYYFNSTLNVLTNTSI